MEDIAQEKTPIIEFKDVCISQQENEIIKDLSVSIYQGDFVYLIGKVGSGKSTFLKTLYADLEITSGTGFVCGFDLHNLKSNMVPQLRRKLGVIFQDFQLLTDRTVNENLEFVLKATGWKLKSEIEGKIMAVLSLVGLPDKINKMPHQLSGGEQQRIAIARALLNNPEVIVADEPTGNLDPETSDQIMRILWEVKNQGRTVIMATHNYGVLKKFAARTLKCENGSIEEIQENLNAIDFSAFE